MDTKDTYKIDYLILINKYHKVPKNWEDALRTVSFINPLGEEVIIEEKAYQAYLGLKENLEKEGVFIGLDGALRTLKRQEEITEEFLEKYGADYAAKIVAKPGYSEHHSGLALDLYLIVDGKNIINNEDLVQYPKVLEKVHQKLAEYGFILRYPKHKEHITGYAYEPWHIRYIDDSDIAKEIMGEGMTLEEYLKEAADVKPSIDLGNSYLYGKDELEEMIVLIKCSFAGFKGCELHRIAYAGDDVCTDENLNWANSLGDTKYKKISKFLVDFHSSKEGYGSFNIDHEYKDHEWYLGMDEKGSWRIISYGYC